MMLAVLGVRASGRTLRLEPPHSAALLADAWRPRGNLVQDDSYDVLWLSSAAEWPGTQLTNAQLVNRVPGMVLLTRKLNLASLGRSWDFVPPTVSAVREDELGSAWESKLDSERWGGEGQGFAWLVKGVGHRRVLPLAQFPQVPLGGMLIRAGWFG